MSKVMLPTETDPKDGETLAPMKGADVAIEALVREGVDVVFAYPGGASLELHQALVRREKDIRTILPRFEQGGGFMAHGYARATGKPGVCMATSGPGATNLVTCIADAWMDSIPLVAITGQVYHQVIGKSAFQETDFIGMTLPIVKHSYLVLTPEELPIAIKEAFRVATTGRPGPVVIDIPKDVQQQVFAPTFPATTDLPGLQTPPKASDDDLLVTLELIKKAERPVLYTGGGIISGDAVDELREFADLMNLPVASTLMGLGAYPAEGDRSLYWFGMHGTVAGNWAVLESDVLICAGARFDDRITGRVDKFAPKSTIIHFDIDRSEHNKNKPAHFPIHTDIKYALKRMIELVKERNIEPAAYKPWFEKLDGWKTEHPFQYETGKHILPQEAIDVLYQETKGDAIITTGVGQHQMWAAQFFKFSEPRKYISSLGLGTMGFGLPAAIGAKVAFPDKQVINIDGLYPDFVKISEGFGVKARRVISRQDLRPAIQEMLAHDGPYLLDVVVPYTEHVLPMIQQGKSAREILINAGPKN